MAIVSDTELSILFYQDQHQARLIISYNGSLNVCFETKQNQFVHNIFSLLLAIGEPTRHLKRRVFLSTVNSILAGMVAVAGGAVAYNSWSAVIVGAIAALSFLLWSKTLIKLQIDDPVETAAGKSKS